ncbi:glycosyltransferase [Streptomyces sp. NPDC052301]|uniref:glycosyltransferase n=1 Tax=Streptomyces sp. NPDC052301 TaxID=3365687 RepID=UPI0037D925E0
MTSTLACVLWTALYGCAAAVHEWIRRRRVDPGPTRFATWASARPSVDVLIPCYNEHPTELEACLSSVAALAYPGTLTVHVVDDGSAESPELKDVYERYAALPGWQVIRLGVNKGKRHAQDAAFVCGRGELVLCVDSDTRIAPGAVTALVRHMEDTRVGAVSGTIHVRAAGTLAELCDLEYQMTNADRACQSTYGAVLCCAGAFVMYRRSALSALWPAYRDQRFLGVPCRQGEDLHLTNLLLRAGLRTRFAADAHAWTTSPDRIRGYLRQQLRWSRSHWRELRWLLPQLRKLPPYAALDVFVRVAPALQYAALPLLCVTAPMSHAAVVGAALVVEECILMFFRAQGHPLWPRYAALRVLVQIPVQVWAMCTVFSQAWLTRGPTRTPAVEPHPWRRE